MKEQQYTIEKVHNHDHFWVENGMLYESYKTIRGLRFRPKCLVMLPDTERVSDETIKLINEGVIAIEI